MALLHQCREPEEVVTGGVARLPCEHRLRALLALGVASLPEQRVALEDDAVEHLVGPAQRRPFNRNVDGSSSAWMMSSQCSAASSTMSSTRSKPSGLP